MAVKTTYDVHITIYEKNLVDFIQKQVEAGNFSPTLVFRDAVKVLKELEEEEVSPDYIKRLKSNIKSFQDRIDEIRSFIEAKGLTEEFLKSIEMIESSPRKTIIEKQGDLKNPKHTKADREKVLKVGK